MSPFIMVHDLDIQLDDKLSFPPSPSSPSPNPLAHWIGTSSLFVFDARFFLAGLLLGGATWAPNTNNCTATAVFECCFRNHFDL
jgi:hypothetical protein